MGLALRSKRPDFDRFSAHGKRGQRPRIASWIGFSRGGGFLRRRAIAFLPPLEFAQEDVENLRDPDLAPELPREALGLELRR